MGLIKLLLTEDQLSLFSDDDGGKLPQKKVMDILKEKGNNEAVKQSTNYKFKTLKDVEEFFHDVGYNIISGIIDVEYITFTDLENLIIHHDPDNKLLESLVNEVYPEFVHTIKYRVYKSNKTVSSVNSKNVYNIVTRELGRFFKEEGWDDSEINYWISQIEEDDIKYNSESDNVVDGIDLYYAEFTIKEMIGEFIIDISKRGFLSDTGFEKKISMEMFNILEPFMEEEGFVDYYLEHKVGIDNDFYIMTDTMRDNMKKINGQNCIYIEREMSFLDEEDFEEQAKENLGIFGSWEQGGAKSYGGYGNLKLTVRAYAPIPSINWAETIEVTYWSLNEEKEVRLEHGDLVYVYEVTIIDSNKKGEEHQSYDALINIMYPKKSFKEKRELKKKVIQYYKDNDMALGVPKGETTITFDNYIETIA